jgi:hypothetical protein
LYKHIQLANQAQLWCLTTMTYLALLALAVELLPTLQKIFSFIFDFAIFALDCAVIDRSLSLEEQTIDS